jgi:uncharacterized LabA/DUF88 family protein
MSSKRATFFIDGFNLFHALDADRSFHKYKWLNLHKLASCFLTSKETLQKVYYFTTYATWDQKKVFKHQVYVKALEHVGVEPIFGAFRSVDRSCRVCRQQYKTYEEKQTDVNIAIKILETAVKDEWDIAYIVSGDSDLIPSLKSVKRLFPNKQLCVIIPVRRNAEELKLAADFHMKMKEKHLGSSQFPDVFDISTDLKLKRPPNWI